MKNYHRAIKILECCYFYKKKEKKNKEKLSGKAEGKSIRKFHSESTRRCFKSRKNSRSSIFLFTLLPNEWKSGFYFICKIFKRFSLLMQMNGICFEFFYWVSLVFFFFFYQTDDWATNLKLIHDCILIWDSFEQARVTDGNWDEHCSWLLIHFVLANFDKLATNCSQVFKSKKRREMKKNKKHKTRVQCHSGVKFWVSVMNFVH